jgi:hypothetical protein
MLQILVFLLTLLIVWIRDPDCSWLILGAALLMIFVPFRLFVPAEFIWPLILVCELIVVVWACTAKRTESEIK